jgi:hypothetical protein
VESVQPTNEIFPCQVALSPGSDSFWWTGTGFQQIAAERFFAALRMTLDRSCHPEPFGFAQDKLREGSGFKLSHYLSPGFTAEFAWFDRSRSLTAGFLDGL